MKTSEAQMKSAKKYMKRETRVVVVRLNKEEYESLQDKARPNEGLSTALKRLAKVRLPRRKGLMHVIDALAKADG